jgi:hypothetical protein
MLKARPSEFFTWDYELFDDDRRVTQMYVSWVREDGDFVWEGGEYQLSREGLWSGNFFLRLGDQTLAKATKVSLFQRCFEVRIGEQALTLKALSVFGREFYLIENDAVVGSVSPDGLFSRRCTISFPDGLSVPVQVFLFWLVVLMWRRAAQSG